MGALALTIAFLAGAQYRSADCIDHSLTGIVACTNQEALMDGSTVWGCYSEYGTWEQEPGCSCQSLLLKFESGAARRRLSVWPAISVSGPWVKRGTSGGITAYYPAAS